MRRPLAVLVFVTAVVGFTFLSTAVHELGHALAWDASRPPELIIADSRDDARDAVSSEKSMHIDGKPYRVAEVERTTIALYPRSILVTGLTLGIAPAGLLPDPVLASTFYALEDEHYAMMANGEDPTGWEEAAMPMIVNAFLTLPVWLWLLLRPHAVSMAAVWAHAAEWRYNVHHAEEIGIPTTGYLAFSVIAMGVAAAVVTFLAFQRPPRPARVPAPQPMAGGRPAGALGRVVEQDAAVGSSGPSTAAGSSPPAGPSTPAGPGSSTSPRRTPSRTSHPPYPGRRKSGNGP